MTSQRKDFCPRRLFRCTFVRSPISTSGSNKKSIKKFLLSDFKTLTEWFYDNYMIINSDNYMWLCKNNNYDGTLNFNDFSLKNSYKETILEIKIDQKLTFNSYIKTFKQSY